MTTKFRDQTVKTAIVFWNTEDSQNSANGIIGFKKAGFQCGGVLI